MKRSKDRAFTLVELLVVIGIIAVLISILLPALGRARDQAGRVKCLSNMRQLYIASFEYAAKNRDQIPIGFTNNYRQMNYMFWNDGMPTQPDGNKYQIHGVLWNAGIVKSREIFYCPYRNDEYNAMDSQLNPWPPVAGQNHRASYSTRPVVAWYDNNQPRPYPKGGMAKLTKFKMKALFADCVSDNNDIAASHKAGVNVIYSDGSGVWVPQKIFWDNLKTATPEFHVNPNNNILIYNDGNPGGILTGVWADLDAQQTVRLNTGRPG